MRSLAALALGVALAGWGALAEAQTSLDLLRPDTQNLTVCRTVTCGGPDTPPLARACISNSCSGDTTVCDETACWDARDPKFATRPGYLEPIPSHPLSGYCRVIGQTVTGWTVWECAP